MMAPMACSTVAWELVYEGEIRPRGSGRHAHDTLAMLQEGSLPRLHFRGKVFVENHHLAAPFHELLSVREKGLSEKESLHDGLIVHGDNLVDLVVDPN